MRTTQAAHFLGSRAPSSPVSKFGLGLHPSRPWPVVFLTRFFTGVAQFRDQRPNDDPVDLQDVLRQVELLDLVSRVVALGMEFHVPLVDSHEAA